MLIRKHGWSPANVSKLAADFSEIEAKLDLNATAPEDHKQLLLAALDEITAGDYAGTHPPQKSYEPATKNLELFAFCWQSNYFSEKMYFKFCLAGVDKDRRAFIFSIHPSTEN